MMDQGETTLPNAVFMPDIAAFPEFLEIGLRLGKTAE
jgi:hypothetical protein